ncbi:PepSY domain-containing protein [Streptomyces sp. NPDC047706]|uniref:PepSY domain-containing protein n=1 Tax=Streptomyces sp. NPDC047706 TaxID=3365486 RepID=UPI003724BF37
MRRPRRQGVLTTLRALAAATALLLLVGCGRDNPLNETVEPFEMVEVDYERAIRLSLAEVSGGELVSLRLQEPESTSFAWESEIATEDGSIQVVRLDATRGSVLESTAAPGREDSQGQAVVKLLDRATVLPGEAAREAMGTTDGRVTSISLEERGGEPVWIVDVLDTGASPAVSHVVDARTGEVQNRTPA